MRTLISLGSFSDELIKISARDVSGFYNHYGGTPVGGGVAAKSEYPGTPIRMPLQPMVHQPREAILPDFTSVPTANANPLRKPPLSMAKRTATAFAKTIAKKC